MIDASNLKIGVSHIFSPNSLAGIGNSVFAGLFLNCKLLETPPQLTDPSTVQLAQNCYAAMFRNCTSLTTAPELTATNLAKDCYNEMFLNCSSLIEPPELPATTLRPNCYFNMFRGCTLLSKSPILPATKYVDQAYYNMFYNCTNMSTITCLLEDLNGLTVPYTWINGVADFGVFYKSPNVTMEEIQSTGTLYLPYDWEVIDYEG